MENLLEQLFQQLINGVSLGSIYALIALGYTMIYGIMKLINFAHGDIYMLGAYFGYWAITISNCGYVGLGNSKEIDNVKVVRENIDYIYKTEELIGIYYSKKEEE